MNHSGSRALGSRCYEQLRVLDGMKDSKSWAECSLSIKQLRATDDMNDLRSGA